MLRKEVYGMNRNHGDRRLLRRVFFRLLPFQILLIVINAVNGIVDGLYASNEIGTAAMSAIGLFGPFNHFLYAAAMMLVSGSQVLVGRYLASRREAVHNVFSIDLLLAALISGATSLLLVLTAVTDIARLFVSQEPDLSMYRAYLLGQAAGLPALVTGQQLFSFLTLENQTRRTMAASITCFVVNAVLDHLLVRVLKMGTLGLGLATSAASWSFFLVLAWYYFRGRSEWRFSLRNLDWKDAPKIFTLGYSGALSRFLEMFRCFIVNGLLLRYTGTLGLSSFAASNSLLSVIWAIPFGMTAVSRILISIFVGEEDRQSLTDVMRIVFSWGMLIMCGVVAAIILLAEPLTGLFYHDTSSPVYQMTVMGFRLLPLCMPMSLFSQHFACYAQVAEKKPLNIVLPIISGFAGVVLFSFILIPGLKINGLYIANSLNGVLCALAILINSCAETRAFPRNLESLMAVPPGFGVPKEDRIDCAITSVDDAVSVSRQLTSFCRAHGSDQRLAFRAGLCLEEITVNILRHGFTRDDKSHSCAVRAAWKSDELILCLRDDCSAFNSLEYAQTMKPAEDGKNIGISLVVASASHADYKNLLGLNVLTLRFR